MKGQDLTTEQMQKDIRSYFKKGGEESLKSVRKHLETIHKCSLISEKKRISEVANQILGEMEEPTTTTTTQSSSQSSQSSIKTESIKTEKENNKPVKTKFSNVFQEDDVDAPPKKKVKPTTSLSSTENVQQNKYSTTWRVDKNSGERYFDLSAKKRLSITSFKGRAYVNMREFYEKDGQMLPTKKGVALDINAWQVLKDNMQLIDKELSGV